MRIPYTELFKEFERVLLKKGFSPEKASACARIFTGNSLDGVYSHGLNRFPVFIDYLERGWINPGAEPQRLKSLGCLEQWDGQLGPGMLNAELAMHRAIELAKKHHIGCVALRNTNHWMRGGTYGWQAADAGCIGICFTNTIGIMPPWGGTEAVLGNNPLIFAIPRKEGHIVLDMAMSQYSYGKMQEYQLREQLLPYTAGYDRNGELTRQPAEVIATQRPLPAGFWKGSGLALVLDLLASILSEGQSTAAITRSGEEKGVSQVFMCIDAGQFPTADQLAEEIISYTVHSTAITGEHIQYPGERTLRTRQENSEQGIPVNEQMWQTLKAL